MIRGKSLQVADRNGIPFLGQYALYFALRFLGTYTATYGGQTVPGPEIPDRAGEISFLDEPDEPGYVDLDRTAGNAARPPALQASFRFFYGRLRAVSQGNLIEVACSHLGSLLGHGLSWYFLFLPFLRTFLRTFFRHILLRYIHPIGTAFLTSSSYECIRTPFPRKAHVRSLLDLVSYPCDLSAFVPRRSVGQRRVRETVAFCNAISARPSTYRTHHSFALHLQGMPEDEASVHRNPPCDHRTRDHQHRQTASGRR